VNVLQLISSGGYYGAENVVVSLSESLENCNCRSVIGVFHNDDQRNEDLTRQAELRGLSVQPIACRGRWDRETIEAIRQKMEHLNIDLLHTHGYKADIYGFLASRKLGVPLVSTCHLWTHDTAAVRFYEFLDSLFLRRFDAVVAVSDTIAESLHVSGVCESQIRVIDNGIDIPSFHQARATLVEKIEKGRSLLVGTVGRLVPQKGMEYFLRAAREVLLEFPNVTFVVIGAGPDREKLEQLALELAIEQNVVFTGLCTDMPGAYASMDVFVLPSIDEGMPMAILEALASKKAVVATDVGAVPRLIIPEKTGLLVAPRDVPALKHAILRLLNDPSLRAALGNAGEALVKRSHSRDVMAQNYLELYEQVADKSGASASRVKSPRKSIPAIPASMNVRLIAKRIVQAAALLLTFPAALFCGFGRVRPLYQMFAQMYALGPGIIGSYLRSAFYHMTLRECSIDTAISFGTYFVHPETIVGSFVSVGCYCVIGRARIGTRTQISSHVEIPSGRHEHARDEQGNLIPSIECETVIGESCWIGASAIIMAKVGDGSTIGAGTVVVKDIPPGVVAVGNPARVIGPVKAESR
jgi:glycosyltransferase involved in cell wall biosynthesis/acetyltransferase-like isoleucine patch superfamily enzyme